MTIEENLDDETKEALQAFKNAIISKVRKVSQEKCLHDIVTRDISNMTTCVACGKELGICYGVFDTVPTGEYWGISRTASKIR